jgi:hypothetical protein
MSILRAFASLALVGLAGGCAAWTVQGQASRGADLAHYRTYAWATGETDPFIDQHLRDQVNADLAQKGIYPAAAGQSPDFLVAYRLDSGDRLQTVVSNTVPYAPGASGAVVTPPLPMATTYAYTEQKLMLDFIDARTRRVFWRGYASFVTERPPEVSPARTEQAVTRILRKYPVAAAARPSG